MTIKALMMDALNDAFAPSLLEIEDVSYQHAGHAGAPAGGESHFELRIKAAAFEGQSRIACHRQVNKVLADLLAGPVHALQITIVK
jgi:BolA protein